MLKQTSIKESLHSSEKSIGQLSFNLEILLKTSRGFPNFEKHFGDERWSFFCNGNLFKRLKAVNYIYFQ